MRAAADSWRAIFGKNPRQEIRTRPRSESACIGFQPAQNFARIRRTCQTHPAVCVAFVLIPNCTLPTCQSSDASLMARPMWLPYDQHQTMPGQISTAKIATRRAGVRLARIRGLSSARHADPLAAAFRPRRTYRAAPLIVTRLRAVVRRRAARLRQASAVAIEFVNDRVEKIQHSHSSPFYPERQKIRHTKHWRPSPSHRIE